MNPYLVPSDHWHTLIVNSFGWARIIHSNSK